VRPDTANRTERPIDEERRSEIMRTNWLKAAILPIGVLALCSTGNAAVVDCNPLTITCTTFQKGGAKFKPLLTSASALGTCTTSTPPNTEAISIKGTLTQCTTSSPNVKVISGAAKGTLYTSDCSCAGLAAASNPIVTPPPGKTNALVVSWKFDPSSTDTCQSGQKSSTLGQLAGTAAISQGPFNPGPPFAGGAFYGKFSLGGPGTGINGIFQGGDVGATSVLVALSTEDVFFLTGTCGSAKGLKGITFGVADSELK
jgi:hypothetical protein